MLKFKSDDAKIVIISILLAVLMSTPVIFDNITEVMIYSILALIYTIPARITAKNRNFKVASACLLMSLFQLAMAFDAWRSAGVGSWLYYNFEAFTALFHAVILISFFRLKSVGVKGDSRVFIDSVLRVLRSNLVSRGLWYH